VVFKVILIFIDPSTYLKTSHNLVLIGNEQSFIKYIQIIMSTPINKNVDPKFEKSTQPLNIVNAASTLEEGVNALLSLATTSQNNLVTFMEAIVDEVKSIGVQASFYDPGIKSFDSALRKAKKGYGIPNQIRLLTDPYRGSMILENMDAIRKAEDFIRNSAKKYGFKIVFEKNTFNAPWSDGYRDINYKFADINNKLLVGELQLQLCAAIKEELISFVIEDRCVTRRRLMLLCIKIQNHFLYFIIFIYPPQILFSNQFLTTK